MKKMEKLVKEKDVMVRIQSTVDGVETISEYSGEYAHRGDAHFVTFTGYDGNDVTKNGMEIRPDQLFLHRTGGFESDMLFDMNAITRMDYQAAMVSAVFLLRTDMYSVEQKEDHIKIHLIYSIQDYEGLHIIEGEQMITITEIAFRE